MKILFVSKYASIKPLGKSSRQYLYSKKLVELGNEVMLVFSRSSYNNNIPKFKGLYKVFKEGRLISVMLNGPSIKQGINFKRIFSWLLFEVNLFLFFKRIASFKPNVVIISSLSILTFLFGVFIKKILKIPLIIEVRDIYPLSIVEVGGFSKKNPLVRFLSWVEKFGYKNADYIISSLENAKDHFEKVNKAPLNFKWLPMGFQKDIYVETPDKQTEEIIAEIIKKKQAGKFIIGYAGSFGKANALNDLMEITQDEQIKSERISFIFIGEGPLKEGFIKKFTSNSTSFFPPVQKKYLPIILSECDILVNTWLAKPIYRFGVSPNKWIDYMYSGRPILLALNSSSRIFNKADCGWQFAAENKLELKKNIMKAKNTDKKILDKLGLNGKRYLTTELSYDKLGKELETILKKVVVDNIK